MKKIYFFSLLFCCLFLSDVAVQAQEVNTKYVKLAIGHGGLHCPFLGPHLEKKLTETGKVQNIKVYKQESYMTFEVPDIVALPDTSIRRIAINVGYPDADVNVQVSDSAP